MTTPLSPDQWHQLESLVDALLDTPPERRAALFAKVSGGDPARREELERLVAACERTYPLLDQPAAERFAALVDTAPLQPSQVIADRYRITRELGRGGMATVYLAHDLKHARDVALKVVRSALVATVGSSRFLREIEIAAQLRHPHIVPLYDSGRVAAPEATTGDERPREDILYYVMPYEAGPSLRERLRREGRLSIEDTLIILRDVCDALGYAHHRGIVHRDIKPDNVLLAGRNALVADFGVARAATEVTEIGTSTGAGVMLGTPAYMAPEQVAADPRVDHRADIYAVGVLAYELLAGRPPFVGESPQDILAAQLTQAPQSLDTHRPDVPNALVELVMKCLEKKAADRWQSADEIVHALETVTGPFALETVPRARGRSWFRVAATVTALIGVGALGVTLATRGQRSRPDVSTPRLAIGILPVTAASAEGDLNWLADGLERQISVELADVSGFEVRPREAIDPLVQSGWPLDSIALVRTVDYFVKAGLSKGAADSVIVTLELMERGIRTVRAGAVRLSRAETTVETVGRRVAERLRPMLGSRAREQELEHGATNAVALQQRRRADHQRLIARQRFIAQDHDGADRALDSASSLLVDSQRRDPNWTAPRVARASLSGTRALMVLEKSHGTDTVGVRRAFDSGIAVLDSVLSRAPRDASALALRGRLRWQRLFLVEPTIARSEAARFAQRDLEAALAIDTSLARAAADLSHIHYEAYAQYDQAAAYATRADRLDAYMEGASQIVNRLALSYIELNRDTEATQACREGMRRFPTNPAHVGCILEVMAWGTGPTHADSAWAYYRELDRLTGPSNIQAKAYYTALVAAALTRAGGIPSDSASAVLERMLASVAATPRLPPSLRNDLLWLEAAVRYRLGQSARADLLFTRLRQRDSGIATVVARRRALRDYLGSTAVPNVR